MRFVSGTFQRRDFENIIATVPLSLFASSIFAVMQKLGMVQESPVHQTPKCCPKLAKTHSFRSALKTFGSQQTQLLVAQTLHPLSKAGLLRTRLVAVVMHRFIGAVPAHLRFSGTTLVDAEQTASYWSTLMHK